VTTIDAAAGAMMEKRERLHHHATQCRVLADTSITAEARKVLLDMARDYEELAATMLANGSRSRPPIT
jgi:hypothetical protein